MNTRFDRFLENQFVPLGLLLAAGLIVVGLIASATAISIKNASNILSVTGSATKTVEADVATWTVSAARSTTDTTIPYASASVQSDAKAIVAFFTKAGIPADSVTLGAIHTDQDYSYNQDANAPKRYTVRQDVTVTSKNPQMIQKLSQDVSALTNQGVLLTVQDPQYYVSALPDIRVALVGQAVDDAKARAAQIAKSTGQGVGRLQSASTGVVQVLAPNSTDVADYGSYDTSTINKQVSVTIRATFFVR